MKERFFNFTFVFILICTILIFSGCNDKKTAEVISSPVVTGKAAATDDILNVQNTESNNPNPTQSVSATEDVPQNTAKSTEEVTATSIILPTTTPVSKPTATPSVSLTALENWLLFDADYSKDSIEDQTGFASVKRSDGTVSLSYDNILNNCAIFHSVGDDIVYSQVDINLLNEVTIEAMVYVSALPATGDVGESLLSISNADFWIELYSDKVRFWCGRTAETDYEIKYIDAPSIPVGQWIHIVCTSNMDTACVYFNGIQVAKESGLGVNVFVGSSTSVYIGSCFGRISVDKIGYLRLYNYIASETEVSLLYNKYKPN